jgi:hypothetical protein
LIIGWEKIKDNLVQLMESIKHQRLNPRPMLAHDPFGYIFGSDDDDDFDDLDEVMYGGYSSDEMYHMIQNDFDDGHYDPEDGPIHPDDQW